MDPKFGGDTSLIMIAAGARHISLKAKPSSKAAKDCVASGAKIFQQSTGQAAIVAPAGSTPASVYIAKDAMVETSQADIRDVNTSLQMLLKIAIFLARRSSL